MYHRTFCVGFPRKCQDRISAFLYPIPSGTEIFAFLFYGNRGEGSENARSPESRIQRMKKVGLDGRKKGERNASCVIIVGSEHAAWVAPSFSFPLHIYGE